MKPLHLMACLCMLLQMQPLRTKAGLGNEASLADSAPHAKRKRKRGGERNARR